MESLLALLLLISLILFVIGLINPQALYVGNLPKTRKNNAKVYGGLIFIIFVLTAIAVPHEEDNKKASISNIGSVTSQSEKDSSSVKINDDEKKLLAAADDVSQADIEKNNELATQDYKKGLDFMGISYKVATNNIGIYIDKDKFIENFPLFSKDLLEEHELDPSAIKFLPYTTIRYMGLIYIGDLTRLIYKNSNINNSVVKIYITEEDNYGHPINRLAFSYNFNRELYEKINWIKMKSNNFPKVAPNFNVSDWFKKQLYREKSTYGF